MNLLYKNGEPTKYIWIAPERTGTRATNLYFKDIGYVPKIIGGSIPQSSATSYTHNTTIHPPYLNNNYALICNVRNPYKRVLSIWKKIHIFNELKNMDVVNKDKDVNTVTDTIFANFLKTDKQEIKSKLILYRCVCKDFNIFVDDHKTWITIYNKNNNLFSFKESYYIRMENLVEDIFKLPFNNNKQHFIVNKDYTFTNDRIKLIKYHFLRNIISYNDIDILYYKNLIEKYFYKSDNESSFMASFYAKLLALDCIEKKEYVEYVKSFFLTTDKNNLTKLIDLNILFEDRNFYDERTANIVHYLNKDWFEKFNYSRDSWK